MGLIRECKPLLAQIKRKDLLQFLSREIRTLQTQASCVEEGQEPKLVTAEVVVKSLMEKYPEPYSK